MKVSLFCLVLALAPITLHAQADRSVSSEEATLLIDRWLELWSTYDSDLLGQIFWNHPDCSYFSSEKEGLIKGYEALIPHHEGFGFESGGKTPSRSLWLEDRNQFLQDGMAVVTAVWFFGSMEERDKAQKGPVTFVLIRDKSNNVRIAHTHFANYP